MHGDLKTKDYLSMVASSSPRPLRCRITTLGKLPTPMCFSHQAVGL